MGLMFYTLGQRQGLGIGGQRDSDGEAWYVAAKNMSSNRLLVVQGHDHPALLKSSLTSINLNWISGAAPHSSWVYCAKSRYRQKDAPCTISHVDSTSCDVQFAEPQWAVTPGQSVVLYESRVCLGGGIIQ